MRVTLRTGQIVELLQGDITTQRVDAIVNAANPSLMGGGGVDGAIHRKGGPAILEECKQIRATGGTLPAGQAVATTAGNLAAKHVIHTVGPIWLGGDRGESETLASCFRESLRVAGQMVAQTIAFPAISTGVYGYPLEAAADVSLNAVLEELPSLPGIRAVRFVLFDAPTLHTFSATLTRLASQHHDLHMVKG
jgi:O-acetyl-ADP-ribose deacetylase (regulator of RNase III)